MKLATGQYINGAWQDDAAQVLISNNAYTGEELWCGTQASVEQIQSAVAAAAAAWPAWAAKPFAERVTALRAYQETLKAQQARLAELIARENGKPLWEAKTEAAAMVAKIDVTIDSWNARCVDEEMSLGEARGLVRRHPLGVCAVLGPFNLPGHLPNGQIVPALLSGNSVVFKPSEQCPAVGAFLVQCLAEHVPAGIINLVQGELEVGKTLLAQADIAAVFFTGSYRGGAAIHQSFAGRPEIMLALEMGGNNPLLVWDVADLAAAALLIVQSAFVTAGQRCVCARRLLIPSGAAGDAILEALQDLLQRVRVGDPLAEEVVFMSGLINEAAADRVLAEQEQLMQRGAVAVRPCERIDPAHPSVLSPGLIDVTGLTVSDEEIFGPLLQIYRVDSFDQAIACANATRYGLSAGLISDNAALYDLCVQHLRVGILNWNRQITGASGKMPFGGVGRSGNHRPGAWHAIDFCQYPCASIEVDQVQMASLPPGVSDG